MTYRANARCGGDTIQQYSHHLIAKAACENSVECQCMLDIGCTDGPWYTRTGSAYFSPHGDCAMAKRNLTFPSHARKLIYQ